MIIVPIVFPDVDLVVVDLLQTQMPLHGYPGLFVDNKRGAQSTALWVRRDGGPQLDQFREAARVGVNAYAPSEQAVADLARTASAVLRAAADGNPILRVQQTSGPSPIADTSGPRRYMTFELWVRGTPLA